METIVPVIIGVVAVIVVIVALFALSYHVSDADECLVITGPGKPRYVVGGSALTFPFLYRVNKLNLGKLTINLQTEQNQPIPTSDYIMLHMSAVATVQIGTGTYKDALGKEHNLLEIAAANYLNQPKDVMEQDIREIMLGKMREATGATKLTDLIKNRDTFNESVTKAARDDMNALGLTLIAFNVQDFFDRAGVDIDGHPTSIIKQMGAAQSAEISRQAREASINADQQVAERNNEYQLRLADLKTQQDTAKAKADKVYDITAADQQKTLNVAQQDAEIAAEERRAVLAERKAATAEKTLDATVRKQADAERYRVEQESEAKLFATQKNAEADLFSRQKDADAKLYVQKQDAQAVKVTADAQADATKVTADAQATATMATADADAHATQVKGEAEGEALRAKGKGEADAIGAQVAAYNETKNTFILAQQYISVMPEIARAVAEPLSKVDSITMYGDGNTTKMVADTATAASQIAGALESSLGIDLKQVLNAAVGGAVAGKAAGATVSKDGGASGSAQAPVGKSGGRQALRPARRPDGSEG